MSDTAVERINAGSLSGSDPSGRRRAAFRIIATLMAVSSVAFGLFTAVFGIVSEAQRIHAFHNAVVCSLLLVLSAPAAVAAARTADRPSGPLMHLTAVAIAGAGTMVLSLTLDPFTLPFVALVGVLWALRPKEERSPRADRPSPVILTLVLLAAAPLLGYALGQAELQRIDGATEHAALFHWVETSFFAVAVLLVGLLVALRPAASRLSAWSAGLALAVLGAASLLYPGRASALDTPWAWAALAGSLLFLAAYRAELRRSSL